MYQLPKRHNYTGQTFTKPSLTIPDQTMDIKTILAKYARGEQISSFKTPIYTDDDNLGRSIVKMDLAEIQELKETTQQSIAYMKEHLAKQEQELKQKQQINEKAFKAFQASQNLPPVQ